MRSFRARYARFSLLIISLVVLGGCYETRMPVIDKGDWAPIAGKFECRSSLDGKVEIGSYEERKDGLFNPDYTYIDGDDGSEMKLVDMGDGLHLVQQTNKKSMFTYFYIDFTDDDHFVVSAADLMSKGAYIEALSKDYDISFNSSPVSEGMVLQGDEDEILKFLRSHDKTMLVTFFLCARQ